MLRLLLALAVAGSALAASNSSSPTSQAPTSQAPTTQSPTASPATASPTAMPTGSPIRAPPCTELWTNNGQVCLVDVSQLSTTGVRIGDPSTYEELPVFNESCIYAPSWNTSAYTSDDRWGQSPHGLSLDPCAEDQYSLYLGLGVGNDKPWRALVKADPDNLEDFVLIGRFTPTRTSSIISDIQFTEQGELFAITGAQGGGLPHGKLWHVDKASANVTLVANLTNEYGDMAASLTWDWDRRVLLRPANLFHDGHASNVTLTIFEIDVGGAFRQSILHGEEPDFSELAASVRGSWDVPPESGSPSWLVSVAYAGDGLLLVTAWDNYWRGSGLYILDMEDPDPATAWKFLTSGPDYSVLADSGYYGLPNGFECNDVRAACYATTAEPSSSPTDRPTTGMPTAVPTGGGGGGDGGGGDGGGGDGGARAMAHGVAGAVAAVAVANAVLRE